MIYGVFSDVHANLEALGVVLDFFKEAGVEGHLCCGDIVGYGPNPDECVARIRALPNLLSLGGNHDLAVLGRLDLEWFNPYARAAVLMTRERLSSESRRYLEGLPVRLETENFTLAHGSPRNPVEEYFLFPNQFKESAPFVKYWPLFVGHTHMPQVLRGDDGAAGRTGAPHFLDENEEILARGPHGGLAPVALNAGSVGQPRDMDSRASCALFDSEKGTFRVRRLAYDIPAVQAKIRAAGLPEFLASRLDFGQ